MNTQKEIITRNLETMQRELQESIERFSEAKSSDDLMNLYKDHQARSAHYALERNRLQIDGYLNCNFEDFDYV